MKRRIPYGFRDFTLKKNRFTSQHYYPQDMDIILDNKTGNKWDVVECHNNNKSLLTTLNNLYERNGYLRKECSLQNFLAKKYKKQYQQCNEMKSYYNNKKLKDERDFWKSDACVLRAKLEGATMTENAKITKADMFFTDTSGLDGQNFVLRLHLETKTGGVDVTFNPMRIPQLLQKLGIKHFNELEGTYVQIPLTKPGQECVGIKGIMAKDEEEWFNTENNIYFGSKFFKGYHK